MKDYGELKQELRHRVLEQLDYGREQPDEEVMEIIDEVLLEEQLLRLLPVSESHRLRTELFYSLRRLDILQSLIEDPEITEIMINGPGSIFIERAGHLQELDIVFESEEKLQDVIQQIVAGCNRNAMPFLIVWYVEAGNPGYFNMLYGNLPGIVLMTVCMGVYLLAYVLSEWIFEKTFEER